MKYTNKILWFVPLFVVLSSCNNLQQLTTYSSAQMKSDTIRPTGFDAATKVGWTSYNDSTHLYFAVDLLDPRVQMSVLRNGLTIFLDTTGKLKEDQSVTYPLSRISPAAKQESADKQLSSRTNSGRSGQGNSLEAILERMTTPDLLWKEGGSSLRINPALDENDFVTLLALDSANYLTVLIGVPIKMIHSGGLDGMDELTVGFGVPMSSGGMARPSGMGGQQQAMGSGSGGGGGRRGGGGGRSGGGSMGGQMGGGQPSGMAPRGPVLEKFWYRTTLKK